MSGEQSLCMLSLPNSGSTWLANLIAVNTEWSRYCMEYFNPLRNSRHYTALAPVFGCELISCYRNIAKGDCDGIDQAIDRTWHTDDYNFTKEVFSPFKLPAFTRHFRCFVLLRHADDTFPPGRARVWSFYEHAWWALKDEGHCMAGDTAEDRARAAHQVMQHALRREAEFMGVPVIEYRDLFSDTDRLIEILQHAIGGQGRRLAAAIEVTRVMARR